MAEQMNKATRAEVYSALDSERAYQISKIKEASHSPEWERHPVANFLVFMQDYLNEALHIQSRDWTAKCDENTMHVVRKVTALGVACMERHGAPTRETF